MVTPEGPLQISRPKKLLSTVLDSEQFRTALISKNNKIVVDTIKNETETYSPEQYQELVGDLFNVMANRENRNNPDKLDGAVQLLGTLDFGKVDMEKTMHNYGTSMESITALSDPYGQVTTFLEAGKILAPHLSQDQIVNLKRFWSKVKRTFDRHPDYSYIDQSVVQILDIAAKPENVTKHRFSPEIAPLDDYYREQVTGNISFKLELWEQTLSTGKR